MIEELKWIHIENFRGIAKSYLDNFGHVNIFIGKNNVGKSTILEAIYLNTTWEGRDIFGRDPLKVLLYRRGLNPYIRKLHAEEDPTIYFSYFFRNWDIPIKIESNITKSVLCISEKVGLDEFFGINNRIKKLYITTDTRKPLLYIEPVEYEDYIKYIIKWVKHYSFPKRPVILLDEHAFRTPHFRTSAVFDKILKLDTISQINIDDLKNFLSAITNERIDRIEKKIAEIIVLYNNGQRVPMSLMGDGIKAAIAYYYALNTKKRSIILLEEPENHLHPGLMRIIADEIAKTKSQVFITTHSIEFLGYVLDSCSKLGIEEDVRVFRFKSMEDGVPNVEVYNGSEANVAINTIGVDLR